MSGERVAAPSGGAPGHCCGNVLTLLTGAKPVGLAFIQRRKFPLPIPNGQKTPIIDANLISNTIVASSD